MKSNDDIQIKERPIDERTLLSIFKLLKHIKMDC